MEKSKKEFYSMSGSEVLYHFETSVEGLLEEQVEESRKCYGENVLEEKKKESIVKLFFMQFADFLVILLIAAAIISFFTGNGESAVVILIVITMNAVVGVVQHKKAEKSLASLQEMSAPTARVVRNQTVCEIPAAEVVAGDIIKLEAGDVCPADGRIIEASALSVNESALTGESLSVEKNEQVLNEQDIPLGDRRNMVYMGSAVENGRADVVVTAVGKQTEMGKIASMLGEAKRRKTPLQESLDKFSRSLTILILAICVIVLGLSVFLQDKSLTDALMFSVALAVAAIPEALSSIITISLAIGTRKMAKENAIMKELKAVEGLGCVSVICSDKTGTLTMNRMTVCETLAAEDIKGVQNEREGVSELRYAMALCNDTCVASDGSLLGDPTETALVSYVGEEAYEDMRKRRPRLADVPFDSVRKCMSTLNQFQDGTVMYTKGAFDVLLPKCNLSQVEKEKLIKVNEEYTARGMRVLAFARKEMEGKSSISEKEESSFEFVGLVAMTDPPRKESAKAVEDCRLAGIRPVMITGDHVLTAKAIAEQIGILRPGERCLEGRELEKMAEEDFLEIIEKVSVYARVSPADKIRIVEGWQKKNYIAAMTGDGVNDAPALKKADVGIAMGITGTEVSKGAASMVLADDNFATIIRAVASGRTIYGNIKNAVKFLIAGNMAAVLAVIVAACTGLPAPFTAVHLLFINLLTDSLPAIALCSEPMRPDILKEKPRNREEKILDKKTYRYIALHALLLSVCVLTAFLTGLSVSEEAAATMAFSTLCLGRLFEGFNSRSDKSLRKIGLLTNRFSLLAFAAGSGLLAGALFIRPLGRVLDTVSLSGSHYLLIFLLAALPFLLVQLTRTIKEFLSKR